jgi:LmbE family N-acetylglucosaminyl deacetylase
MSDGIYLLVVSPHPDDCEFGISGTAARLAKEGKETVYIICTNGDKGTEDRTLTPAKLAVIREKEELAAAKIIGVKETVFLRYPDQQLEDCNEFRMDLCRQIRRFKPHVVATTDPHRKYTWHRDHRICGLVTCDAVFPYSRNYPAYPQLIKEGLEPHTVREMWFWGSDDINLKQDITGTINQKMEALKCHESQFTFNEGMRNRMIDFARMNAKGENFEFGEAFHRVELRP